jgi:hypothetical protein
MLNSRNESPLFLCSGRGRAHIRRHSVPRMQAPSLWHPELELPLRFNLVFKRIFPDNSSIDDFSSSYHSG